MSLRFHKKPVNSKFITRNYFQLIAFLPTIFMKPAAKIFIFLMFFACLQTARADWTKQNSNTLAWLHDVFFVSQNKGFIAGSGGTLLSTKDGGKSWTKEKLSIEDSIEQIYFSNENTGWLLCRRDFYNRGANASSYILKTNDGGANWKQINFGGGRERITKIVFAKNKPVLAIGESGVLLGFQSDSEIWKGINSPTRYLLLDGVFTGETRAVIVGAGGGILFTENAGANWNKAFLPNNAKTKLNRIFFVNEKSGWAAGGEGQIYQTINGGITWRAQSSGITQNLTDIFFLDTAEGWAIGDGGAILHTTTAGNVWTIAEENPKHKLERIFFNGKKGWAVGFGGTILSFDETKKEIDKSAKPQLQKRSD